MSDLKIMKIKLNAIPVEKQQLSFVQVRLKKNSHKRVKRFNRKTCCFICTGGAYGEYVIKHPSMMFY